MFFFVVVVVSFEETKSKQSNCGACIINQFHLIHYKEKKRKKKTKMNYLVFFQEIHSLQKLLLFIFSTGCSFQSKNNNNNNNNNNNYKQK